MARIQYTTHARLARNALGLSDNDVQRLIGEFDSFESDPASGLVRIEASIRGVRYALVYMTGRDGLLLITLAEEVAQ